MPISLLLFVPSAAAATGLSPALRPSIEAELDGFVFRPHESFVTQMTVHNPAGRPLREIRISVSIFSRDSKQPFTEGDRLFHRTLIYRSSLQPGSHSFSFSRRASRIALIGTYPIRVEMRSGDRLISTARTTLVILPENAEPDELLVSLIWDVHLPAGFDVSGKYVSNALGSKAVDFSRGNLDVAARSKKIKLSYAISPLFALQLSEFNGPGSISGYREPLPESPPGAVDQERKTVPGQAQSSSDTEANPARRTLDQLNSLVGQSRIELLDSPLAHASLAELAESGWHSDIFQQIDRGRAVLDETFPAEAGVRDGFFAPVGKLHPGALADLSAKNVGAVVASQNSFPGEKKPELKPYQLQDTESNRVTTFFYLPKASTLLSHVSSTSAVQRTFGDVVSAYLQQRNRNIEEDAKLAARGEDIPSRKPPVVVLAPSALEEDLDPQALQLFYDTLQRYPWIKTVTLSEALKASPPDSSAELVRRPISSVSAKSERARYLSSVSSARFDLKALLKAAQGSESLGDRLWPLIYLAEDTSWPLPKSNLGAQYLDEVKSKVAEEFSKIEMNLQPVTLTGSTGKIPVEITNHSQHKIDLTLEARSSQITFPDGATRAISLTEGSAITVIPVEVPSGKRTIKLHLKAGGKVIATREATVTGTSFIGLALWLTGGIVVLSGAFMLVARLKKRATPRGSPPSSPEESS